MYEVSTGGNALLCAFLMHILPCDATFGWSAYLELTVVAMSSVHYLALVCNCVAFKCVDVR